VVENGGLTESVTFESIPYNAEPKYLDAAAQIPLYREDANKVWFRYLPEANVNFASNLTVTGDGILMEAA
jgi:hypothetical protein